jgi:hypothetical protein
MILFIYLNFYKIFITDYAKIEALMVLILFLVITIFLI